MTTKVQGTQIALTFTDADGNQLADTQIQNTSDNRLVWKNVEVYLGDDFYAAAPADVKNFTYRNLDCVETPIDWVAQCYQNRSTNITEDNLDNCLVTADFGTAKECFKCEEGYTYDAK